MTQGVRYLNKDQFSFLLITVILVFLVLFQQVFDLWLVFLLLGAQVFFFGFPKICSRLRFFYIGAASFLFLIFIQSLDSSWFLRSFSVFLRYFFLFYVFFLVGHFQAEQKKDLGFVLIFLGILLSLHGTYQVFFSDHIQPASWASESEQAVLKRAFSVFDNPNLLGTFLLCPLMIWFFKFSESGLFLKKIWLESDFVLYFLSFGLLLTQSRGAILSFLFFLFCALFLQTSMRKKIVFLFFVLCLGFFLTKRAQTLNRRDLGVNQRVELYKGIYNYLSVHWLKGSSPGSFQSFYPVYRTLGGYYPLYAHNHLLEVFCESGIFALILLVLSLLALLRYLYVHGFYLPIFCLLAFLINSMFDQFFSLFSLGFCVTVCVAIQLPCYFSTTIRIRWPFFISFLVFYYLFLVSYQSRILTSFSSAEKDGDVILENLVFHARKDPSLAQSLFMALDRNNEKLMKAFVKWLHELQKIYPHEAELYFMEARILQKKDPKIAHLLDLISLGKDSYGEKYCWYVARGEKEFGRWDKAKKLIEKSLKSNPDYRRVNPWYDQLLILFFEILSHLEGRETALQILADEVWVNQKTRAKVLGIHE